MRKKYKMRHDSKLLFEIKIMFSILIQLVNKIFNIRNETRNFLIHLSLNQLEIKMIDIIKNQGGLILPSGIRVRYFSDSIVVEYYHAYFRTYIKSVYNGIFLPQFDCQVKLTGQFQKNSMTYFVIIFFSILFNAFIIFSCISLIVKGDIDSIVQFLKLTLVFIVPNIFIYVFFKLQLLLVDMLFKNDKKFITKFLIDELEAAEIE